MFAAVVYIVGYDCILVDLIDTVSKVQKVYQSWLDNDCTRFHPSNLAVRMHTPANHITRVIYIFKCMAIATMVGARMISIVLPTWGQDTWELV